MISMLFVRNELQLLMDILSQAFIMEAARFKPTFFTRKRKMTFSEIVLFVLSNFKTNTQMALNRFFYDFIKKENTISQQA